MNDNHYPTVDADFILDQIRSSPKINKESEMQVGSTYAFILKGDKPIYKSQVFVRLKDNQVTYMEATALAIRLGFMTELLDWLELHRNWKDGAYFIPGA